VHRPDGSVSLTLTLSHPGKGGLLRAQNLPPSPGERACEKLKGSGDALQVHTYSFVSSAIERLKAAPRADRRLRQTVERLFQVIDESQERR